jgi:hypothetical protein
MSRPETPATMPHIEDSLNLNRVHAIQASMKLTCNNQHNVLFLFRT